MKIFFLLLLGIVLGEVTRANPALQDQLAAETRRREMSVQPLQKALVEGQKLAAGGEILRAWEGLS